jgi:hypothetical protein
MGQERLPRNSRTALGKMAVSTFEIAIFLVCLNHVVSFIANGNHSAPVNG